MLREGMSWNKPIGESMQGKQSLIYGR